MSSYKVKVNGAWRDAKQPFVKVSNTWKPAKAVYVKVNGAWRKAWESFVTISVAYSEKYGHRFTGYSNGVDAAAAGSISNNIIKGKELLQIGTHERTNYGKGTILIDGLTENTIKVENDTGAVFTFERYGTATSRMYFMKTQTINFEDWMIANKGKQVKVKFTVY